MSIMNWSKSNRHVFLALATLLCVSLAVPVNPVGSYSGDVIQAYFSDKPITYGGFVTGTEWVGFNVTTFPSADGLGTNGFYIKYDASSSKIYASLYVWSDSTPDDMDLAFLYLDMEHDDGNKPDTDDFIFFMSRGGVGDDFGYNSTTESWEINLNYTARWTGYYASVGSTWGAMWVIPVTIKDNQKMGIAVRQLDYSPGSMSDYPSILDPFIPSSWAEVVFSKLDSSITVSAIPVSITYVETVSLSATINRAVSRGTVTLQYSEEGGVWADITSGTPSDGKFSYTWTPAAAGSYNVRALWAGDIVYRASTSASISLTVKKASSSTSTSLSASTIMYRENVTIKSGIAPALPKGVLTTEYSLDKVKWTQISSSAPSDGSCSVVWTPPSAGTFYIRTSWNGTENYLSSTSPEQTVTVNRAPTSLQVSVSPKTAQIDPITHGGATVQVTGSMTPALASINVTIVYTRPDGTTTTVTTKTTSTGEFTDTLSLVQAGTWSISASWAGNTNYLASSSSPVTVSVGENWLPYIVIVSVVIIAIIVGVVILLRVRHK